MSTTANHREIPLFGGPGKTSFFASEYDQRFSYCLYIPRGYSEKEARTYPLFVVVHGSLRNAESYRDWLIDFAEEHQVVILCPLFPSGIIEPGEGNNYKEIEYKGIRYDLIVLKMVEEASRVYRLQSEKFMLYGFSGGGQFSHRFFLLHPERLLAVSVGAPGSVTVLDPEQPWWIGIKDTVDKFGITINVEELRKVPVHLVVGGDDNEPLGEYDRRRGMPGGDRAGINRIEKMETLRRSLESHGVPVTHEIVPGLGHENSKFIDSVTKFFGPIVDQNATG